MGSGPRKLYIRIYDSQHGMRIFETFYCYLNMLRQHQNLTHGLQYASSQLVYWEPEGHKRALQPLMA